MDFSLVLMSFAVGVLIGLTSMGGAALMAPFLILVLGVKPVMAVGTDLVYGGITKIVGAWLHFERGTVDLPVVWRLSRGSIPGGIVGALTVILLPRYTHDAETYVKKAIGVLLVLVAVILLMRVLSVFPRWDISPATKSFLHAKGTTIWGVVVGWCVGATSVGSGSLLAPFLLLLYPAKTSKVIGTDVFHAALLVSITALIHISSGGIDWKLVPVLLAGSIPGVLLGTMLSTRIPTKVLRTGLGAILLFTGVEML